MSSLSGRPWRRSLAIWRRASGGCHSFAVSVRSRAVRFEELAGSPLRVAGDQPDSHPFVVVPGIADIKDGWHWKLFRHVEPKIEGAVAEIADWVANQVVANELEERSTDGAAVENSARAREGLWARLDSPQKLLARVGGNRRSGAIVFDQPAKQKACRNKSLIFRQSSVADHLAIGLGSIEQCHAGLAPVIAELGAHDVGAKSHAFVADMGASIAKEFLGIRG